MRDRFHWSADLRIGTKWTGFSIAPIQRSAFLLGWLLCLLGMPLFAQTSTGTVSGIRFQAIDIRVDSKDRPLAAYQLEFSVPGGKIVGIEGGEHGAFAQPPWYDPKAMQQDRVIIAAFSTNSVAALPRGNTRVATIHIQTSQPLSDLRVLLKLHTAAEASGNKIPAEAIVNLR